MADQAETTIALIAQSTGTGAGLFTATVTSNDTVTLSNFTDVLNVYVVRLSNNTEATATVATNVVTITQAGLVTDKILIFAQGT